MPLRALPEKEFFNRKEELAELYLRALEAEKGNAQSLCISGPRGIGKTELLKQLFNHLFWGQDKIAPFYYSVNSAILSVQNFSRDYLTRFICQRLASEKKESALAYLEGLSMVSLTAMLEERKAAWALEMLDRFSQSREPMDSLRIALNAPYQSILSTGMPVVVIIDEFQRLKHLNIEERPEPSLVSVFEMTLSSKKAPHIITGNQAEMQEMSVTGGLAKIDLQPLRIEDSTLLFSFLLDAYGLTMDLTQNALLNHLGGNPFYLRCIAKTAGIKKKSGEKDLWMAYVSEITGGSIYLYWTAILKNFFPKLGIRRNVLEVINKVYHTGEPLTQQRISKAFSLSDKDTEMISNSLYNAGFISGEFGVLKAPADRVLIDFVDCLYTKEIHGRSYRDIEKQMLEKTSGAKGKGLSFEMTIPMTKDAELIAAQCIEQIGKNLHFNQEVTGQLQMAVIEAFINAIEHSKGEERKIYLTVEFIDGILELSIESSGREFVSKESGEPFLGKEIKEGINRGWGITIMKNFADSVSFEKTERGTKVVMVKSVGISAKNTKGDSKSGG